MTDNNELTLLAFNVALLALVIALGQLAQQVFGTAAGYRRCQHSVIGQGFNRKAEHRRDQRHYSSNITQH